MITPPQETKQKPKPCRPWLQPSPPPQPPPRCVLEQDISLACHYVQVVWSKLYKCTSSQDAGTLFQLRNLINRRSVIKQVRNDMNGTERSGPTPWTAAHPTSSTLPHSSDSPWAQQHAWAESHVLWEGRGYREGSHIQYSAAVPILVTVSY